MKSFHDFVIDKVVFDNTSLQLAVSLKNEKFEITFNEIESIELNGLVAGSIIYSIEELSFEQSLNYIERNSSALLNTHFTPTNYTKEHFHKFFAINTTYGLNGYVLCKSMVSRPIN